MGKKLILALALVALMAAPAFASVQNVKVSGDLKTTSVIRNGFDLGYSLAGGETAQNVFLSTVGLNVQADLTDNVSAMLRLTNERLYGDYAAGDTSSGVDLDTAYVTMKEMLYSPLTVTIGRQTLAYGSQFLIGDGDGSTNVPAVSDLSGGVNFDAIKAVLSYDTLTVDLFAAKISEADELAQNDSDDVDLYGVNAALKLGDKMGSVIEAYTFVQMDKSVIDGAEPKADKLYVPGLRVSTNPMEGMSLSLEGAYQMGDAQKDSTGAKSDISAYGLQGMANFALPLMKDMKPVLSVGYTYLSSEDSDDEVNGFNALYNNQNVGRIWSTLLDKSNLSYSEVAFEVVPMQDVTAKLTWFNLRQNKAGDLNGDDILNQPYGTTVDVTGNTEAGKKEIGNEFDLDLTYAYTEDVKFGLSAGYFKPGSKFADSDQKDSATQLLSSVAVAF